MIYDVLFLYLTFYSYILNVYYYYTYYYVRN